MVNTDYSNYDLEFDGGLLRSNAITNVLTGVTTELTLIDKQVYTHLSQNFIKAEKEDLAYTESNLSIGLSNNICEASVKRSIKKLKLMGLVNPYGGKDYRIFDVKPLNTDFILEHKAYDEYIRNCPKDSNGNLYRTGKMLGYYPEKADWADICYLLLFTDLTTGEVFIKVGRSFVYCYKGRLKEFRKHYNVEELAVNEGIHKDIFFMEQQFHEDLDKYHYIPKLPFGGSVLECFDVEALKLLNVEKAWMPDGYTETLNYNLKEEVIEYIKSVTKT